MAAIKRVLIVCGAGVVTSTIAIQRLQEEIDRRGLSRQIALSQGNFQDALADGATYDLVCSTTQMPASMPPMMTALPLVSTVGLDQFYTDFFSTLGFVSPS
ncbi:hypothetical protein [Schleiferilactobacillus shenzhenensis]|uniref:Phosphotransferase system EIIB component type 2/3 domain-containing protein n=1 Tax=Schleiferilactobacillus shenzhenensis LY-73 TaxID=1231336 RepID=U4TL40_9LACO|nr:hypothetical protein [Schleiferilactobacillus shenzhenensis]ERL64904.1 hypothetical protein L248_0508 [Schleiferilactobacillus shenzhenensis LY-73]